MYRLIFYLILLGVIFWGVKKALSPRKDTTTKSTEIEEEMVQDPVCGCYVPKRHAHAVYLKGEKLFFCSKECHQKYMGSKTRPKE